MSGCISLLLVGRLRGNQLSNRMFARQHLIASRTLTPAFDQRQLAFLNRFPTICLRAFSTTPFPTDNPSFL